ncbi:hypothetical protein K431DRAFT_302945 [Polychaeton citri CBS 116435]|uniref:Uncharacterized protein n=1 Tax=Polychaeton citri CBS 116435 TaxID=1314669 RepID=A0A9P4QBV2_9PEZI|nr:hypothetical protein K431DRAFT_302945 [Polychaeton citri CBS 116435]
MRTLLPSRLFLRPTISSSNTAIATVAKSPAAAGGHTVHHDLSACLGPFRCFAQVNDVDKLNRDIWFTSSAPRAIPELGGGGDTGVGGERKSPDERTLKLGKTIGILHERLPSLLQSPLPSEILSPQIKLHLFPSTHPHLPTVSGKIPYIAALWTSPVAWGRVPLIGNVKLTILSERMVRNGGTMLSARCKDEKLVVKWKTCGKTRHRDGTGGIYRGVGISAKDPVDRIRDFISGASASSPIPACSDGDVEAAFCGIFVFEFDEKGRIVKHTIEHTEEGGHWDRATRVASVTDWLFGRINGKRKEDVPALAWYENRTEREDEVGR